MIILIEGLIGIILFTIIEVSLLLKNPLTFIGDYPPAIQKKCIELKLIPEKQTRYTKQDILRKAIAMIFFIVCFAFILYKFNGANSFFKGFLDSYILWLIIDWYDAIFIDCIWFCHSKKVRIPGTEDMKEYKDYLFHIKHSCVGMLLGLPVALLVGCLVMIL